MEKKYVVPEGMLKAGMMARNAAFMGDKGRVKDILEAAIRWLAENPIVPTDEQMAACEYGWRDEGGNRKGAFIPYVLNEWQRRMFLAPEPEVPEAVKDLVDEAPPGGTAQKAILEAYRRGQNSK